MGSLSPVSSVSSALPAQESRERASLIVLGAMIVCAMALMVYSFRRSPETPKVDTRRETGTHLAFVLFAPTGRPDPAFIRMVKSARDSMRAHASRSGMIFTTIGVSDNWNVETGVEILRDLGPFDELSVGRNWLNTSVEKYINAMNAIPGVPQLLIMSRHVRVDTLPYVYGEIRELARLIGRGELDSWISAGLPLSSPLLQGGSVSSRATIQ